MRTVGRLLGKLGLALGASLVCLSAHAWQQCIAIDGDTLFCDRQKIRLTNVYAAELNEAGGAAAKKRMAALIASGRVTLLRHGHDKYGRILAEVFVDGRRIEQADIGPRAGRGLRDPNARRPYFVPRQKLRTTQVTTQVKPYRSVKAKRHRTTHTYSKVPHSRASHRTRH